MNREKVIKGLEHCALIHKCDKCPYSCGKSGGCINVAMSEALDLINQQKAEIEKLEAIIAKGDYSARGAREAMENWHKQNNDYILKLKKEMESLMLQNEELVRSRNNLLRAYTEERGVSCDDR